MDLQQQILRKINEAGGKDFIIDELKLIRKTIPKSEHYFIDTSVIYINSIDSGLNLELEIDYIDGGAEARKRIAFYKRKLKLKPNCKVIKHCVEILEFSLLYIKKLRFIA